MVENRTVKSLLHLKHLQFQNVASRLPYLEDHQQLDAGMSMTITTKCIQCMILIRNSTWCRFYHATSTVIVAWNIYKLIIITNSQQMVELVYVWLCLDLWCSDHSLHPVVAIIWYVWTWHCLYKQLQVFYGQRWSLRKFHNICMQQNGLYSWVRLTLSISFLSYSCSFNVDSNVVFAVAANPA